MAREAIRRTCGLMYHEVQILAGLMLASGNVAQMATGEGKTIVAAIPAILAWIDGHQTHVATSGSYLAARDCRQIQPALELLGASVALLPERNNLAGKRRAYQADVVYGTGQEFGNDYLYDQWKRRIPVPAHNSASGGSQPLDALAAKRRELAVVDEIDSVLIDQAQMPLAFREATGDMAISGEKAVTLRMTRQRFYQLYAELCGMTATAETADDEFDTFYQLKTVLIPRHRPCRRVDLPDRFFASKDAKFRAIVVEIMERHRCGQPVLVGTRTIGDSQVLSELLNSIRLPHQVLKGVQDADEAALVAQAGRYRAVTIATDMAGRGTDIPPDERALAVGGLFVIGVERHETRRGDRQLAGRAGRRGDFGFSRFFVSADDDLLQQQAPKLANRLRRTAGADGEVHDSYGPVITTLQHAVETQAFAQRRRIVEHDRSLDKILANVLE